MEAYTIRGGSPLRGEVNAMGAKNAVLPLLAACVLVRQPVVFSGCPDLSDVRNMLRLLSSLGCSARREGAELYIDASGAQEHVMPEAISKLMRSSIFMLGTHGHILCSGKLRGGSVHLDYPSVGATENVMMAAVGAAGDTVIHNAAREPEIVDLAGFLNACGGYVRGAGTDTVMIRGEAKLHGVQYAPVADRITAGTLLLAGAATQGDVFVRGARAQDMQALLAKLHEAGCDVRVYDDGVRAALRGRPRAVRRVETAPFPGFPTDMQAQMMALLALSRGTSVVAENVFENRMQHAAELMRMGADIQVSGRVAVVRGVEQLTGARVTARDLRGGAALCIAALAAQGQSVVENIALIDRGHERLEEALGALGADIRRITVDE